MDTDKGTFIYLFGVLRRFQHCTGHITTGSWKGRGNQYIQFVRVLYCKLPTNGKQLPAFPLEAVPGIEPRPQRWEARVLPLCHRGPSLVVEDKGTDEQGQVKFLLYPGIFKGFYHGAHKQYSSCWSLAQVCTFRVFLLKLKYRARGTKYWLPGLLIVRL